MGLKAAIKSLDAFPRAEDHLLRKTQSGAFGNIPFVFFFFNFFYFYIFLGALNAHVMFMDGIQFMLLIISVDILCSLSSILCCSVATVALIE